MLASVRQITRYFVIALMLGAFIPFMYIFRSNNRTVRRIMCKSILFFSGIRVEVEGEFDTDARLLMLNHQSMLDIISVETIHPQDLCWISKKEITDYPYYGHINKAPRMISVDREDKAGLVKLIADVKDRLSNDRPIAIFPEGTRGKGPEMLSFKPGAKMIAEKLGLKVQPVVVVNSAGFLSKKHFSLNGDSALRSDPLKIVILPAFLPQKLPAGFAKKAAYSWQSEALTELIGFCAMIMHQRRNRSSSFL